MPAPFKRLCLHAARAQNAALRQSRAESAQCQTIRAFSSTPSANRASPAAQDNDFVATFPGSNSRGNEKLDPIYEEDDISSLGHAELDQHRELREMIRIAAWEMPQLGRLHQPYDYSQNRGILRWRYTTYMGEVHPAAAKVVVEFKPSELPDLTEKQLAKLCKLAGPRYSPVSGLMKMSCESFETQAQNKRYLGDTIQKLLLEAKNPFQDAFEDIPLDTRHVKYKPRPKFPEHWLMTEERKAELEARRRQVLLEEGQKVEKDKIVSGVAAIEVARQIEAKRLEEPIMAEARQPLARGKQGKREMGQTGVNQRR